MLFLTRWFGVTASDVERNLDAEKACIEEIVKRVLLMQSNAASQQHRPIARGTHAKGTSARAKFEVFDVTFGRDPVLAQRLVKGIFAKPGVYPATVRFGNADPKMNSDFKADVRSLSFSVDLTLDGTVVPEANIGRQDFSLQNTSTLPINDCTSVSGDYATAYGLKPSSRPVGAAVRRQITSVENSGDSTSAGTPENTAVSEAMLREQRAVSPRLDGYREVFSNSASG